jgi:hypothetical protein
MLPPPIVQNFGPKFMNFGEFRFYRPGPVKGYTGQKLSARFKFIFGPTGFP